VNGFVIWLVALWMAAAGVRAAAGFAGLHQARIRSRPFPPAREARLRHWPVLNQRGRRARLVTSDAVSAAAVLGGPSPVIAISPVLLDHLDDEELDRIVVHEWAHVQRYDDALAIVQVAVRVMAGWHPAVWWIGRQLHLEREIACDEAAVGITGSARTYAACLLKVAGLRSVSAPALPAPGAIGSSQVARRIVRVLQARPVRASRRGALSAVVSSAALLAVAISAANHRLVATTSPDVQTASRMVRDTTMAEAEARPVLERAVSSTAGRLNIRRGPGRPPAVSPRILAAGRPTETIQSGIVAPPPPEPVLVSRPSGYHLPFGLEPLADLPGRAEAVSMPASSPDDRTTPWVAAAEVGVAAGRGSQKAAVATAGFFTRFGKKIAGAL
jgi:beta-lactamase regulating signal transducer with metallopeptidase domain